MGQKLKSKMKLSIILVFLTFALTIDAAPPTAPPGLYLAFDGRQQLEQTRGGALGSHHAMYISGVGRDFADREQVDEKSLAMDRFRRGYYQKEYGSKPSPKTRANEDSDE